jgi:hypothetical protein
MVMPPVMMMLYVEALSYYMRAILNLLDVVLCDNDSTGNATTSIRSENNHTTSSLQTLTHTLSYATRLPHCSFSHTTTTTTYLLLCSCEHSSKHAAVQVVVVDVVAVVCCVFLNDSGLFVEVKKSVVVVAVLAAVASTCVSSSNLLSHVVPVKQSSAACVWPCRSHQEPILMTTPTNYKNQLLIKHTPPTPFTTRFPTV